jgi:MFS family permease
MWDDPVATFAGCLMFGFSVGNVITLPAVFAQHEFDPARYGIVIARVWTAGQLVFAFGPVCAGLLLQATGAGWPVLAGCAACQAVAALLCLHRRPTGDRR